MQKLVLFQIGNRQFGMDMSLVTYIQQSRPVLAAQPESGNPDELIIEVKEEDVSTLVFYFSEPLRCFFEALPAGLFKAQEVSFV